MPRLRLTVQYDGEPFCGWQRQAGPKAGRTSVQEAIETALCRVFDIDPAEHARVRLFASGRTDTGVHARAMPLHFDCPFAIPPAKLPVAVNKFLVPQISILHAEEAAATWDARFDARLRWYRYQVLLSPRRTPLGPRAWQVWKPVDIPRIAAAIGFLQGEHDFAGFRDSNCQSQRTRLDMRQATLHVEEAGCGWRVAGGDSENPEASNFNSEFEISTQPATRNPQPAPPLLAFDFKCRSFLQHQVRFMVGSLLALGRGNLDEAALLRIRDHNDRPILATCAPPAGLCLMGVAFGDEEVASLLAENPPAPSF